MTRARSVVLCIEAVELAAERAPKFVAGVVRANPRLTAAVGPHLYELAFYTSREERRRLLRRYVRRLEVAELEARRLSK